MTINLADNDPRIEYTVANGNSQQVFTVPFEFFDDGDLNVYQDGTLKTLTTHYITADDNNVSTPAAHTSGTTGFIHFTAGNIPTASGSDIQIVITRSIDIERTTDFPSSGPFDVASLNTALDKIIAIQADLQDDISRSLRLTDFDLDATLTLPAVNSRKGTVLAFDSSTGAAVAGPTTSGVATLASIATDVETLADIEDGTIATDAISDTAAIASNVTTVAGIASNVTTVAGISSDVSAVAAYATDIGTVATNISSVNTVATNIADVVTVANDLNEAISEIETAADDLNEAVSEIDTVATNIANVNKVGAIDADVTTVAGIDSDVTTVAGISANVTTVAGIDSDVTTVSGISADVTTVAADGSDIGTVAGISSDVSAVSGISADVTTVAGISSDVSAVGAVAANVTTVANNLTDINSFANTYFIGATAPSSPTEGDLWFDTTNDIMKVYDGSGFVNAGSSVNGTAERVTYTATSGQTTFAATYDAGYVDVYLNGVKLIDGTDFTATDGANVVLASGAALNDTVDIVGYGTFNIAIPNISGDATPQLGGNLDLNSNDITGTGDIDITGAITVTGGITNLIRTQVFTASGTYTPATNATKAIVHVVGAGGGGGGTESTTTGEAAAAGGGGAGGLIISDVIDVSGGSYTSTITIGAAGVGANDTAGTDGGDTTYADGTITLTAGGGNGGTRQAATNIFKNSPGGFGGANTVTGHTPIVNTEGESGYTGLTFADADISNMVISGTGGSAYPYGSGGIERQRTVSGFANGEDADGYGGGGSGSISHSTTGDKAGGDGTDGVVIVFEYL